MRNIDPNTFRGVRLCEECPVGILAATDYSFVLKLESNLTEDPTSAIKKSDVSHRIGKKVTKMARIIGCQGTTKELPNTPEPMPSFGSDERDTYARACPAYVALQSMVTPESEG